MMDREGGKTHKVVEEWCSKSIWELDFSFEGGSPCVLLAGKLNLFTWVWEGKDEGNAGETKSRRSGHCDNNDVRTGKLPAPSSLLPGGGWPGTDSKSAKYCGTRL